MSIWERIHNRFRPASNQHDPEFLSLAAEVQRQLGYTFKDLHLLQKALTHASFSAMRDLPYSYERLEFLGDAVLQLTVTEHLFKTHPHLNEGTLTKYRTILVNGSYLADCAESMRMEEWIRMTRSAKAPRNRENDSIMADVVEAVIGALYLDGGLEVAQDWILREIVARKPDYADDLQNFNFKGQLAERCQRLRLGNPDYEITHTEGPDHDRWYTVQVIISGKPAGFGEGHSKKEASQRASEDTLNNWDLLFPDKPA